MVKHGVAKKRRSGTSKVTRKAPKRIARRVVGAIVHPDVKSLYDKNKSPWKNFEAMGLATDPNEVPKDSNPTSTTHPAFVGFVEPKVSRKKLLSNFQVRYIESLLSKYPDGDTKKMEKDIEVNNMQYTATKLENLIAKYNQLKDSMET